MGIVNRLGGDQRNDGPLRLNVAKVRVPLSAVVAVWVARKVLAGLWWLVRHPLIWLSFLVVGLAVWVISRVGPWLCLAVVLAIAVGLVAWWRLAAGSFTRLVVWRWRAIWRRALVYRYVWQPAMVTANLAVYVNGSEFLPKIVSVRSTGAVDQVRVRMLPGQTLEDWAQASPRLAQTFSASECRVRSEAGSRRELVLWFLIVDPLTEDRPGASSRRARRLRRTACWAR